MAGRAIAAQLQPYSHGYSAWPVRLHRQRLGVGVSLPQRPPGSDQRTARSLPVHCWWATLLSPGCVLTPDGHQWRTSAPACLPPSQPRLVEIKCPSLVLRQFDDSSTLLGGCHHLGLKFGQALLKLLPFIFELLFGFSGQC